MKKDFEILVADDHPLLLKGLVQELTDNNYKVSGVVDGFEALKFLIKNEPKVAILDIEMPMLTGFEVINKARKKGVQTKFMILTSHKEKGFILRAKELNISGYLLKDEPFGEIENCLQAIVKNDTYFSTTFSEIFNKSIIPELDKLKLLSPSERTVIRLVAEQKSSKQISEILTISTRTVEKHRANIIVKLDIEKGSDSLTNWTQENKELIFST